ncbi:hypothetical protein DID88_003273 [Monilinia fructigena]|uniref:H/ACA ribonucleoprotein complex subunit 2 n=1 Tax=Monilinia fructigena TaxID=38457 RepID=A0A395IUV1_9HELO|nr:hypothetical protein DID88_003273 [Monilinia fructigena]
MAEEQNESAAWPVADSTLSQEILDLVQQAQHYRQLKKEPMRPPRLSTVESTALGRACGVSRAVIAASITTNEASDLMGQIRSLKDKVERLQI